MYEKMTDKELHAYILDKLNTDNQWLRRGVIAIYKRQTFDEQVEGTTTKHNGQGFSFLDAPIMTSIAKQIESGKFSLSQKQVNMIRKIMRKYVGQLVKVVREKNPVEKSEIITVTKTNGLIDGELYDLGNEMGVWDSKNNFFRVGNVNVWLWDTVYW